MSVDIGDVVGTGFRQTFSRNGVLLMAGTYVLAVLNALLTTSLGGSEMAGTAGPSLPISPAVASVLLFVSFVLSLIIGIGAVRAFVENQTGSFPPGAFTRNLGWAIVNLFVGVIVFTIAVVIGFVFLVIPGFFLLVSLYFWGFFVIVEDQNFIEGLQNSWSLTKGNRITLFGLGVIVFVIAAVVNLVFSIPSFFLPGLLGTVVNGIATAFMSIFFAATGAQAFNQLREGAEEPESAVESETPDELAAGQEPT